LSISIISSFPGWQQDHPESKFEGSIEVLQKRHLEPKGCVYGCMYVEKAVNNVEMQN